MDQLLDVNEDDPLAIRDRAMMELMYGAGLRLAEMVSIDVRDVNLSSGELRVVGKGDKERKVPFSGLAAEWVSKWLKVRGSLTEANEKALLFLNWVVVYLIEMYRNVWRSGGRSRGRQAILAPISCATLLLHMY